MSGPITKTTAACPRCGRDVVSLSVSLPWGSEILQGECGPCSEVRAAQEQLDQRRRAAAMARASGVAEADVWPKLQPHLDRVMAMTMPGLILVRGDMMSGRSTLARAWVEQSIRQGIPAALVEADRLCRMDAAEYGAQADGWHGVTRLAIDGLGQGEAPLRPWQADRFSSLLSARHRLMTLVTVPLEVEVKGGGDWLAARLGVDLARRVLAMAKITRQGARLVASEVLGE